MGLGITLTTGTVLPMKLQGPNQLRYNQLSKDVQSCLSKHKSQFEVLQLWILFQLGVVIRCNG